MASKQWIGKKLHVVDEEVQNYIEELEEIRADALRTCTKLLNLLESEPACSIYSAHQDLARKVIAAAKESMRKQ